MKLQFIAPNNELMLTSERAQGNSFVQNEPKITFGVEAAESIIEEIAELAEAHHEEVSFYKDIPLNIDFDRYLRLDQKKSLCIFTLRDEAVLVGYAIYLVSRSGHHKDQLFALQDSIFIKKEKRGIGRKFIAEIDKHLFEAGVDVILNSVKADHNFGHILEEQGYEQIDIVYGKRNPSAGGRG